MIHAIYFVLKNIALKLSYFFWNCHIFMDDTSLVLTAVVNCIVWLSDWTDDFHILSLHFRVWTCKLIPFLKSCEQISEYFYTFSPLAHIWWFILVIYPLIKSHDSYVYFLSQLDNTKYVSKASADYFSSNHIWVLFSLLSHHPLTLPDFLISAEQMTVNLMCCNYTSQVTSEAWLPFFFFLMFIGFCCLVFCNCMFISFAQFFTGIFFAT